MDERNVPSLPSSLVNGRLEGISVPDLMWNLCRRRSTGVLQLTARGITKKVYIDAGRIVFATSGDPNDRLGELLLREGVITLDQLERATAQLTGGKRLGAILVEAGHLTPDNLVRGVLSQVKGIVLGLFPWDEGEYAFVEGPLPTAEVVTLGMRTAEILLQGIRQIRSFSRIRKSVGPPSSRFRLDPDWRSVLDGLDIRDGERMLLQRVDECGEAGASVDGLCREVFLSNYEIYQALWAFRILGIVHEVDRSLDTGPGAALEGRLERMSLPQILVRLCRGGETGVLHVSRGALERTLHIKEGVCVFATSNAIDDGLIAHLLRRGVISLRDREETARRLLSNKRVGTILLEMGVIDENDLRATVREQLSEIVFDTFRWDQGEFHFLDGELPTIEDITLDRTVEDLVFAGVRRVTSWSRIREGCGGLGARLVLLPQYLSVLDKMSVGPEEWELISLLRSPKSVLEICRGSMLGDFRSCQILWALRMLGAIGEAPIEVSVDAVFTALDLKLDAKTDAASAWTPDPGEPAAVVEAPAQTEDESVALQDKPEPEPAPIPLSEADETAEIVSEPWRLAAERPANDRPEDSPALLAADDVPPEPALALTPDVADGDLRDAAGDPEPEDGLPRFELGEPGTGLEDMKVDMRPAESVREFELGPPASGLEPEEDPGAFDPSQAAAPPVERFALPLSSEPESGQEPPAPEFEHTTRIPREEVEAALRESAEPPVAAAEREQALEAAPVPDHPETPWEPPDGLEGAIASFNARHVVLFRTLRAEVGAGAANFVRSCRGSLDNGFAQMFAAADLRADGSWDPDGLKRAIVEHRVTQPHDGFRELLDHEVERLGALVGERRASALAEQLAAIP